jgi:hypothetical protein
VDKAKPKQAATKRGAVVKKLASSPARIVVETDPRGVDRGLLVLAGVLLGVVAVGGAVLGGGFRHVVREIYP